jgi:toxin ParE1/3/4
MSRQLFESPRAKLDFADIINYLVAANPAAALRFDEAYTCALQLIEKMPFAGGNLLLPDLDVLNLRYSRPKGFENYLIFYRVKQHAIEIVRVLHGSRDIARALRER